MWISAHNINPVNKVAALSGLRCLGGESGRTGNELVAAALGVKRKVFARILGDDRAFSSRSGSRLSGSQNTTKQKRKSQAFWFYLNAFCSIFATMGPGPGPGQSCDVICHCLQSAQNNLRIAFGGKNFRLFHQAKRGGQTIGQCRPLRDHTDH